MATLEQMFDKLRELGHDPRAGVDLAPPITEGSLLWLKERFATKLERELPADLEALLRVADGGQIGRVTLLGARGHQGLVDHNLEWRAPPSKWTPGQIVFGHENTTTSFVIDIDAGKCHVSDYVQPRWIKTFDSFADLLLHLLREQLDLRVRDLK